MPVTQYLGNSGIYDVTECLSAECKEHYSSQGWVLIRRFFDLENEIKPIFRDVNNLIRLKLEQLKLSPEVTVNSCEINTNEFIRVCKADREKGGEIYRATRHLPSLFYLFSLPLNIKFARFLMDTEYINLIPYLPIRIDIRGEEKYLFDWHQDYPYIQGSPDAVIMWMPLMDLQDGYGGIKLIPESHKEGIQKVKLIDTHNKNANGAHTIKIADAERFEDLNAYQFDVEMGDIVVFNTLLLHKSVPMSKGNVRWTTQLRYSNFCNEVAISKGWPGGMIEGSHFENIHPEHLLE